MSRIKQSQLIEQGFEVHVLHCRIYDPFGDMLPNGGSTQVTIAKNGRRVSGSAECSDFDNYNKKIGFQIAAGRALKAWTQKKP